MTAGCAEVIGLEPPGGGATDNAGGSNAGGSNAGGSNAGGSSAGGSSTGGSTWALTFGGKDIDHSNAVAANKSGAYVAGTFNAEADFGGTSLTAGTGADTFLFLAAPDESVSRAVRIGDVAAPDDGDHVITAIATNDAGEVAIAGYFTKVWLVDGAIWTAGDTNSNLFVIKLDPAGEILWAEHFGNSMDSASATAVALLSNGNVLVSGFVTGDVNFNGTVAPALGGADAFVVELGSDKGEVSVVDRFGGTGNDVATGMAVDDLGNVTVVGSFEGTATIQGGTQLVASGAGANGFVVSLNNVFNVLWAKGLTTTDSSRAVTVAVDPANPGGVYVGGTFLGALTIDGAQIDQGGTVADDDMFLLHFTDQGSIGWQMTFADTGPMNVGEMGLAAKGNDLIAVGHYQNTIHLGDQDMKANGIDAFIAGFNTDSTFKWARFVTGAGDQHARAVAFGPSGDAYVTGDFATPGMLDKEVLAGVGETDGFLMRILP